MLTLSLQFWNQLSIVLKNMFAILIYFFKAVSTHMVHFSSIYSVVVIQYATVIPPVNREVCNLLSLWKEYLIALI